MSQHIATLLTVIPLKLLTPFEESRPRNKSLQSHRPSVRALEERLPTREENKIKNLKNRHRQKYNANIMLGILHQTSKSLKSTEVVPVIPHLHLWCYKQTGNPNELQHALINAVLGQHEPVKVVLCQVERLPMKSVGLTHLVKPMTNKTAGERFMRDRRAQQTTVMF